MLKNTSTTIMISILLFFTIFAVMLYSDSALADTDDFTLQRNLITMSELTAKWSKKLIRGDVKPGDREKIANLLSLMSQLLKDMSENYETNVQKDYGKRIDSIKEEWNPFDRPDAP